MSRRSQSRRRRSYGRRQHETRERRQPNSLDLIPDAPLDSEWTSADGAADNGRAEGGPYSSFSQ